MGGMAAPIYNLTTMINLNSSDTFILALRLELVRAYQAAEDYSLCESVILLFWFGTANTRGQRISASKDIGGAA